MKKIAPYFVIILLATALTFSVDRCSYNKSVSETNAAALADTTKHFTNALGTQTASIKALQVDKKQLQLLVSDKDAELKALAKVFSEVKAVIKYESVIKLDTVRIVYKDTVPCVFERSGSVVEDWYRFEYNSNQNGIQIDSLNTWTTTTAITGFKKSWFLGQETLTTDITNSNPHIKITEIKSAEVIVPVPWYKKWYVWLAVGAVGGAALSH